MRELTWRVVQWFRGMTLLAEGYSPTFLEAKNDIDVRMSDLIERRHLPRHRRTAVRILQVRDQGTFWEIWGRRG